MSEPRTIADALTRAAAGSGALVEHEQRRTFAELAGVADAVARAVPPGVGRVALRVENSFHHVAAVFGVWRAGAALVPLNPRLTAGEADALIARARAVGLSVDARSGKLAWTPGQETAPADPDLAAIAFTSGTTGQPKGVEVTQAGMLFSAATVARTRRDHAGSVAAVVSPLSHLPIFVSHVLCRILTGGTIVLGSFDPDRLVAAIAAHGVTDLPLVPAMVEPLLTHPGLGAATGIAKVTVGSALTTMETKQALAARFPAAEIIEAYGQTESTDGLTMTIRRETLERPGTVGRPHQGIEVAIMDPAGQLVSVGTAGEVVCRGPMVMRGYLDDPAATAEALRDGWLHTGDLGRLDADGYLYITGRLKEIIISGGENVSPVEVEAVLAAHPAVADVAVVGVPDPRWGERVAAAVVAQAPIAADALVTYARERLARYKCPRTVVFVETIPRTSAGKVRRQAVREELLRGARAGGESIRPRRARP